MWKARGEAVAHFEVPMYTRTVPVEILKPEAWQSLELLEHSAVTARQYVKPLPAPLGSKETSPNMAICKPTKQVIGDAAGRIKKEEPAQVASVLPPPLMLPTLSAVCWVP